MSGKKIACVFVVFLQLQLLAAQQPAHLVFNRLDKSDGLASNTVFQSARDLKGFLWIATQNGLQRFDGQRLMTFQYVPGDTTSIPKNNVNHLFIDSKDRLWLLFDKTAGFFDKDQFRFTAVKIGPAINNIRKITENAKGEIFLLADTKMLAYNEKSKLFGPAPFPLKKSGEAVAVSGLAIDEKSGEWWFTGKEGSIIYNHSKEQLFPVDAENKTTNGLDSFKAIRNARYPFVSADGSKWMVSWLPFSAIAPVIYRYDKQTGKLKAFEKLTPYKTDSYYEVWSFFQQSNGTLWIYGMGLLAYFNPAEDRFIRLNSNPLEANGIEYDYVSNLYEDKERNVWVSTNNGLYRFNTAAQVFQNIANMRTGDTGRLDKPVSAVVETGRKSIWVSTFGNGVFSYDSLLRPIAIPLHRNNQSIEQLHISYMTTLKGGFVAMGTRIGEINIAGENGETFRTIRPALLKGDKITQLLEDHTGRLWIASGSGIVIRLDIQHTDDTAAGYEKMLAVQSDIMKLYEDNSGNMWVCTSTDGVYQLNGQSGKILNHFTAGVNDQKGLLNAGATDVIQYNDSIFLIASGSLCILNIHSGHFNYLTSADGFPTEQITSLQKDHKGRIWAMLDGGIYCLNLEKKLFVSFDASDGIVNDIFQVAAGRVLSDGRIAVGTTHDLMVFDPDKAMAEKSVPPVNIVGLLAGDKRLRVDSVQQQKQLLLQHDDTYLRVELSTLTFSDRYYILYQLEGIDSDWKKINNAEITFQLLPPGEYTLLLKAQHGDGRVSENITKLQIVVEPPFWRTWWFYGLVVISAAVFIYWLDKRRINRKTAVLKMRSDIADELHKDINETLGNITILSEMANRKAEREPGKSKDLIEEINRKSQQMLLAMDDILWSINPENDSMESFILRFREYIDALKSQYETGIDLLVDKNATNLPLEMKRRNQIYSLFKSGVTNVVRTGGRNCKIYIAYERQQLIYTLEYDTMEMDTQRMNLLRQRNELAEKLEALRAKLEFKEYQTKAMFVLSIPV
jgi:ligand-binding sensor domain-containing protein